MCAKDSILDYILAISTFLAVVVALFGENIRKRLFHPQIVISLRNPIGGELTTAKSQETTIKTRYYHLKVDNKRKGEFANNTQVVLLGIEDFGPSGSLRPIWDGEVPLCWMNQNRANTNEVRRIGRTAYCDLLSIDEKKRVFLHLQIRQYNLKDVWEAAFKIVITLQARSDEVSSQIYKYQISWDGEWVEGEKELSKHLEILEYKN
jgi:hypothetical protein